MRALATIALLACAPAAHAASSCAAAQRSQPLVCDTTAGEVLTRGPDGLKCVTPSEVTTLPWANITDTPLTFPPSAHSHPTAELDDDVLELQGDVTTLEGLVATLQAQVAALEALLPASACGANRVLTFTGSALVCVAVNEGTTPEDPGDPEAFDLGPLAAFPGCGGSGCKTRGGFSGTPTIHYVTNLNNSGAGSLRACVEASGPRVCLFSVGGTIPLTAKLRVQNPYLTIAGQTAPGGGILLDCRGVANDDCLRVETHDVVVRYLRAAQGPGAPNYGSSCAIRYGAHNVVMDHMTCVWTRDENLTVWTSSSSVPHDVTVSWSLFAEPMQSHATSIITGSASRSTSDQMTNIDFHHNFIANSSHRNPLWKHKSGRFASNIIYNWSYYATRIGGGAQVDFVHNLFRRGPMSPTSGVQGVYEIEVFPGGNTTCANGDPSIYVSGNSGPHDGISQWDLVYEVTSEVGDEIGYLLSSYQRATPLATPASGLPISADPVATLEDLVLPIVGASRRLDCDGGWVSNRAAFETRIVDGYPDTGSIPEDSGDLDWPTIDAGTACTDTDADGISDEWEEHFCGAATACAPNETNVAAPWTNLEAFLSGMAVAP